MNKKTTIIRVLILILFFEACFFFYPSIFKSGTQKKSISNYYKSLTSREGSFNKNMQDNLSEIIDLFSIEGAIQMVETSEKDSRLSFTECHPLLHLIGHEAWERKDKTIPHLVERYGQKCQSGFVHGIEAQITLEEIDPVVRIQKLNDFCTLYKTYYPDAACFHGVGHAYYQMTKSTKKALQACDLLEKNGKKIDLDPCYGGVFGEFSSRVVGIDPETGLEIPGDKEKLSNEKRPLSECSLYDAKYQKECVSNLASLTVGQRADEDDLSQCIFSDYEPLVQEYCVKYFGSVMSREKLLHTDYFKIPQTVNKLPKNLFEKYIDGFASAIHAYKRGGEIKNWEKICKTLTVQSRVDYCENAVNVLLNNR